MTWLDDNWARAVEIAAHRRRNYIRQGGKIHRELSPHQMEIGVLGEIFMEQTIGIPMDDQYHEGGDPGWDFDTPIGTLDVKTFQKPFHLAVEVGKIKARYYVLAGLSASGISLWGWATHTQILYADVGFLPGHSIKNHLIKRHSLWPMCVLLDKLKGNYGKLPDHD